jgi:hypothetical protein
MIDKVLKYEYAEGTTSLKACLQQHTRVCLYNDFDQIRQTNLVPVTCCECGKLFRVPYDSIAKVLFCEDCKDTSITMEHLQKLAERLKTIQQTLIAI